jgi:hypothetical protein
MLAPDTPSSDLARVGRWLAAGGTVRALVRSADSVTLALCSCDTGAEMERLTSSDARLLAELDGLLTDD